MISELPTPVRDAVREGLRDEPIRMPMNHPLYTLGTALVDGVLEMKYGTQTSDTLILYFDVEMSTEVSLTVLSGWTIEPVDKPHLYWTFNGVVWTAKISKDIIKKVVGGDGPRPLPFDFRSATVVHDPVIIVDRPPPRDPDPLERAR